MAWTDFPFKLHLISCLPDRFILQSATGIMSKENNLFLGSVIVSVEHSYISYTVGCFIKPHAIKQSLHAVQDLVLRKRLNPALDLNRN